MFLALNPMESISLNSFVLLEHLYSYVTDFNTRNKLLTHKLLKQGHRYHKLRKTFSKFYRRYYTETKKKRPIFICLFVFVALRPMSTAMVIAGRSVHLTTLFPGQA